MSPPIPGGYVTHTCENHEEMLRIVVETRNDVKHVSRTIDAMCTAMDVRRKEFETIADSAFRRIDDLERTRDHQAGVSAAAGQMSAAVAFIISLVISVLAIGIPWLASKT